MGAALLERLLHRSHIVNIRGNSYRMQSHAELSEAIHTAPRAAVAPRLLTAFRRSRCSREIINELLERPRRHQRTSG